jgi:hypothetical protein
MHLCISLNTEFDTVCVMHKRQQVASHRKLTDFRVIINKKQNKISPTLGSVNPQYNASPKSARSLILKTTHADGHDISNIRMETVSPTRGQTYLQNADRHGASSMRMDMMSPTCGQTWYPQHAGGRGISSTRMDTSPMYVPFHQYRQWAKSWKTEKLWFDCR